MTPWSYFLPVVCLEVGKRLVNNQQSQLYNTLSLPERSRRSCYFPLRDLSPTRATQSGLPGVVVLNFILNFVIILKYSFIHCPELLIIVHWSLGETIGLAKNAAWDKSQVRACIIAVGGRGGYGGQCLRYCSWGLTACLPPMQLGRTAKERKAKAKNKNMRKSNE